VHPTRHCRAPESKLNHAHTARDCASGKRIPVPRLEKMVRPKELRDARMILVRYPRVINLKK
jgi:hypothetical protein